MQEEGDNILLRRQLEDGPCGVECRTIQLACQALMDEGWEMELGEILYAGETQPNKFLVLLET